MPQNPLPTKESGQRSQILPMYIYRVFPQWNMPEWVYAEQWRAVVRSQPIAMACRDTLISNILALDWKIETRDSDQRDELEDEMDYYTELLEDNGDVEYSQHVEWVGQDV